VLRGGLASPGAAGGPRTRCNPAGPAGLYLRPSPPPLMHPDQRTPDTHRYRAPDSKPPRPERAPEQDQTLPPDAEVSSQNVLTPEPEEPRLGEAGASYTGRQLDDRLKTNPRVDDADAVTPDEGDEA